MQDHQNCPQQARPTVREHPAALTEEEALRRLGLWWAQQKGEKP